ncbi:hypothetical protein K435DRAFT_741751 [Dendrothele bispora CBS 962.96]|uniref:Zn(2)-C6 fungal-type domain-containing protein n=1 Tax=Dendrothele bispora (strain CBS 962.96) TaxID=1314807 RepID=A0A4S8MWN6_DENBC|nr:hypothetical protein K435DRAFT_741751 [Dendrothele bispora CBS 962.96]
MNWPESEPSDDNETPEIQSASRKRSSRACDQCRKTKSKCERGTGDEGTPCKSCQLAGTACTFLGPSYKRGPPKGYIHAIEQRWHQVESLLGAILQCSDPRVQGVVADLRQDDLAREILARVDMGPYGPAGRRYQPQGATKEDFFASVLRSNGSSNVNRDQSRSRRQSRVSREKVSSTQDRGLSVVPTQEWQDNLSRRLASGSSSTPSPSSFFAPGSSSSQRRRIEPPDNDAPAAPDWNNMYTFDQPSDSEDHDSMKDPTEGMGELSLTENQEIRYHGKTSGLHLLSKSNRTDDRKEGGIWKLPMARVWPPSKARVAKVIQEDDILVDMPPIHVQDHLVDLYFTYIHPVFPVIHRSRFLSEYASRKQQGGRTPSSTSSTPKPESSQKVTNLLLLTMFALTARFSDDAPLTLNGKMWEAGCEYMESARHILTQIFDRSRPSTVQSLLLLGYREFGIGSMEQGWIYIGMGIRMAIDLGLNRNAEGWKHHGHDLFSRDELQTRRQIWWVCCLADRYGSVYMGRPIIIRDEDFDTPFPDIDEEDEEIWQPMPSDALNVTYPPVPGKVLTCFRATAALSVVLGNIVSKIYPVRASGSRKALMTSLESQLDQWYLSLPECLRYDVASKRSVPMPHVLFLHIRYWGTVLLLNRAFIPNWRGIDFSSRKSTTELKAFDLAQGAASHVSAIVTAWRERFTLKRVSPFLTSYMLNAGIMHILTLTLRPSNVQASHGLRQCMTALKEMEILWPSASRAWDLLHGVNMAFDAPQQNAPNADRPKRPADDAFGQEKTSDYLQREVFRATGDEQQRVADVQQQSSTSETGVQDLSTRMMAHMLGLDIPGIEPSTSYYPGYEWWPRPGQNTVQPVPQPQPQSVPFPQDTVANPGNMPYNHNLGWIQGNVGAVNVPNVPDYAYNINQYL